MSGEVPLVPAATVVLLRDSPAGPETLMLRKNKGQAFGGMWVFPGGRVEDGDAAAAGHGADEDGVARCAAVREAAEETGLVLAADDLVAFAHWVPPESAPRRFSTWFFVVAVPPGLADVVVDGGEIGDHVWATPQGALDRHAAGEVELAPPTWVTLHSLVGDGTAAELAARLASGGVDFFATRVHGRDGVLYTVWAGDAAYESGDLDAPGARHRLAMREPPWVYERSEA